MQSAYYWSVAWNHNQMCLTLVSLDWFQPNFKDYPVYLTKFKQCLSKAMHFMKIHIVNTMQNLTSQLTKRVRKRHITSSYTADTVCAESNINNLFHSFISPRIQWAWLTQTMPLHFTMLSLEQLHLKFE